MTYICWVEPGDLPGGVAHRRITREEALKCMAKVKAKHPEATDERLLHDFIAVHWAWEESGEAQEP